MCGVWSSITWWASAQPPPYTDIVAGGNYLSTGIVSAIDLSRRRGITQLPPVRQPILKLADRHGRKIGQQVREITLRVDVVPAAGAGQAGKNRRSPRVLQSFHGVLVECLRIKASSFSVYLSNL